MNTSSDLSTNATILSDSEPWHGLRRLQRHLSSFALIVVVGLTALGAWTMSRMQQTVETEVGHRAATALQTMLNRHADDLSGNVLSPSLHQTIDAYFHANAEAMGIHEMKVWNPAGTLLYASRAGLTGQTMPISDDLAKALSGQIAVGVDDDAHGTGGDHTGPQLFEVYVPIHLHGTDRIVVVAEFYQNATVTTQALARAQWQTWVLIASLGVVLVVALTRILRHAATIMLRQRADLGGKLAELARRLDGTKAIQARLAQDVQHQHEVRNAQMRQINADIHDGIGQLLTVALLRMKPTPPAGSSDPDTSASIRVILEEAMNEVQALLIGTSQQDQVEMPLVSAVSAVVATHRRHTGTAVHITLSGDLPEPVLPVRVAICRLVKEGLHNAFKHADGQDQRVRLMVEDGCLTVAVCNAARLPDAPPPDPSRPQLGLRNLRHRIEALGGTFRVSDPGADRVEIAARFERHVWEAQHG